MIILRAKSQGGITLPKLEVYFDFSCPYCLWGHGYLKELIGDYPDIQIEWVPCEAHPRPERYGRHSDLCLQGMYFAIDSGADVWKYCEAIYGACHKDKIDIENPDILADYVSAILDPDKFAAALKSGRYAHLPDINNNRAYRENGVWAVPSYRMDGRKLDSVEGVGVSLEQLKRFLDSAR